MDFNTFERAFVLINQSVLSELVKSKKTLENLVIELNEEKKMLSNDIRFSMSYYSINASDVDKKIEEIEIRIPDINNKVTVIGDASAYTDTQSRLVLRVRELVRERNRLLKKKSDFQNKVRRLNQDLVDLYLDIEELRRKLVDVNNAIYIRGRADSRGIKFSTEERANAKEVYEFFRGINLI